jgi:hypothetical protein
MTPFILSPQLPLQTEASMRSIERSRAARLIVFGFKLDEGRRARNA